jgi:hypothetical protein
MTSPKLQAKPYQKVNGSKTKLAFKPPRPVKPTKKTQAVQPDMTQPEIELANLEAQQKRLFVAAAR